MFYSLEKFYSNRKSSDQHWSPNQWTEDQGCPHRLRKLESPELPSVDNRCRKCQFSFILVTSSPWTGTQSEIAPFQQLDQSGISSPCRLNCGSWATTAKLYWQRNLEDDGRCHSKVGIFHLRCLRHLRKIIYWDADILAACTRQMKTRTTENHLAKDFYGWPVGSQHSMGQGQSLVRERLSPYAPNGTGGIKVKVRFTVQMV